MSPGTRRLPTFAVALLALSLPAFLADEVGARMESLSHDIDPASPYFTSLDPLILYGLVPLTTIAACVMLLTPGLLLVAASKRTRDPWSWLLEGFLTSFLLVSVTAAGAQWLMDSPLTGDAFAALCLALQVPGLIALWSRGPRLTDPIQQRSRSLVAVGLLLPAALVIALTPKIFWEAMNGDGVHGFEASRLLLHHGPLPFFPRDAGAIAGWPGINGLTYAYPPSWFIRLFGEYASAARLPFMMLLPLLVAGIVAVSEARGDRRLRPTGIGMIAGSVIGFGMVMAYSATYNPYCSDIAMPGVHDGLVMVFILGAINAYARGRTGLASLFTLLALLTTPAGLVMGAALIAGLLFGKRPFAWRSACLAGLAFAACVFVVSVLPTALQAIGVEMPGTRHEHGPMVLLKRFKTIRLLDWERFLYAFMPCGLYPAACLLSWRRSDHLTRALMLATLGMFCMHYVVARTSIHVFVPIMILPLAAFWRQRVETPLPRGLTLSCAALLAGSLWMALPEEPGIYMASKHVGHALDVSAVPGYETMDPDAMRAGETMLDTLLGVGSRKVPGVRYGGSPLSWFHYAHQEAARKVKKRYKLCAEGTPAAKDVVVVRPKRANGYEIHVLDRAGWREDKVLQPAGSRGKDIYQVPRHILFSHKTETQDPGFIRLSIPEWLSDLRPR